MRSSDHSLHFWSVDSDAKYIIQFELVNIITVRGYFILVANRDLLTSLMPKTVKDINLSWNITFLFPESSNLTTTVHPPAIVNFHKEVATQNRKLTKRLFEEIVEHADPRLNVTVNDIDKARPKMVLFYNYSSSPVNWARQFEGKVV